MAVKHKRSDVPGKVPLASDMAEGEIVINIADKIIYTKDSGGTVTAIADLTEDSNIPVTPKWGDTPPLSPKDFELWFNTDTLTMMIWYVDIDSSQWVEINPSAAGLVSTNLGDALQLPTYASIVQLQTAVPSPNIGMEAYLANITPGKVLWNGVNWVLSSDETTIIA